jgi:leucyl aminopeptidase
MPLQTTVRFVAADAPPQKTIVLLATPGGGLGPMGQRLDEASGGAVRRAMTAADFEGKAKTTVEVLGAGGIAAQRLIVAGTGKDVAELDRMALGGAIQGALAARKLATASIMIDAAETSAEFAADLALGTLLRGYAFETYKSKARSEASETGDAETPPPARPLTLHLHVQKPDAADTAFAARRALAEGVALARDLINEPANVLGPVEFAARLSALAADGLEVEVLDEARLRALKMGSLLSVAQGSVRPPRIVVMRWTGAAAKETPPLCFGGKGVCFDTGGISIKPAANMEDMKGDMAGAAAVSGLMLTLARRKAPVNAIGIVGLVENMPSGTATRPGDIVTAMNGTTIEINNTDAEGRLVLADVVHYAEVTFKPRVIIDLATLTGAVGVALGKEFAGLFTTNDALADALLKASIASGERIWRLPLDKGFDKMLDSRFADIKNSGGRGAGASTGAHFIGRFVTPATPWAHLDIAGVVLDSAKTDVNTSWSNGFGVRLLDRYVSMLTTA